MQGDSPVPDAAIQKFAKTGGQLAKNVFMLSNVVLSRLERATDRVSPAKSGLVTTAQGLRIASLGGVFDHNIFYTSESAPVCPLVLLNCIYSTFAGVCLAILLIANNITSAF